jgi:hypothetical protein
MGQMNSTPPFTGTVDGLTYYKVRGSDKILVRKKGGPTKKQIQKKDSFAVTRKNNMEFGGRAKVASQVMEALRPLKYQGDYNLAGPINSMLIPIQELSTEQEKGQRNVVLSKKPDILTGLNLNRRTSFESIVLTPLEYSLSKKNFTATITIPELKPDINFMVPGNFSWYRLMVVSGIIEDMYYNPGSRDNYLPREGNYLLLRSKHSETNWMNVYPDSPNITIDCSIKITRKDFLKRLSGNNHSQLLGIGIAFGNMQRGQITMAKYIGGAKILAMV